MEQHERRYRIQELLDTLVMCKRARYAQVLHRFNLVASPKLWRTAEAQLENPHRHGQAGEKQREQGVQN